MAWLNSLFTIEDAIARGFATWDLLITGWGYQPAGAVTYDYSKSFPKVGEKGLPSIYGVAIGNESAVDRCFVTYALEKLVPEKVVWDAEHRVAVGSPIMFPQAGQREIVQTPPSPILIPSYGKSTVVVYPTSNGVGNIGGDRYDSTLFTGIYKKADGTAGTLVDTAAGAPFTTGLLHLVFYLQPPIVGAAPIRAPATWGSTFLAAGAETLMGAYPTYGRKTVSVTLRNGAGGASTWRISTIKNINLAPTVGEVTETSFAAVPASQSRRLTITNCDADAVLVYSSGAAGVLEVCAADT